jgi:hypothetical protein
MVLVCLAAPLAAGEETPQYMIETHIIAIPADEGSACRVVSDRGSFTMKENGGGMGVFGEIRELVCSGVTVSFREEGMFDTLLWNGAEEPPEDCELELLSSPKVSTQEGKKAAVMSGSALQYFMPGENGCYTLHNTAEENCPYDSPQLLFSFTPRTAEDASGQPMVELELELTLRSLEGREKLHGVGLDVGPPIIAVRSTASELRLAFDQWHLVSGHLASNADGGKGDFLLVLLRVRDARKLDLPQAPPKTRVILKDRP